MNDSSYLVGVAGIEPAYGLATPDLQSGAQSIRASLPNKKSQASYSAPQVAPFVTVLSTVTVTFGLS